MAREPLSFFAQKEPQSIMKHEVLEKYLRAWAGIVAHWFSYLQYVDGFSGPGFYISGEECSPALAARVLSEVSDKSRKRPAVRCWHVEKDAAVYTKLLEDLQAIPPTVQVKPLSGEFHDHLPAILREIKPNRAPAFFFVDPFGFSVHFEDLAQINHGLKDGKGTTHAEVLINYATASIQHWLTAPNSQDALDRFYGTTEWRDILSRSGTAELPLLDLYERQLRLHWAYVLSVAIPVPNVAKTYFHLVFATDKEVAVKIMKHVMGKPQAEGWQQLTLFDGENFEAFKQWIHDTFRSQTVLGKKVLARAMSQHPYDLKEAERAVRELIAEGAVFAHKSGKPQMWDWLLMFDLE